MQNFRKDYVSTGKEEKRKLEYFEDATTEVEIHFIFAGWFFEEIVLINPVLNDKCEY